MSSYFGVQCLKCVCVKIFLQQEIIDYFVLEKDAMGASLRWMARLILYK